MAGRYAVPSLRNQSEKDATKSVEEANSAPSDSSTAKRDSNSGYESSELVAHFWPTEHEDQHSAAAGQPRLGSTTLNDAAATLGHLTWVKLYHGAKLRWESDRIIFVKSNLEFLPTPSEDLKTESCESAPQQPIAVFMLKTAKPVPNFDFAGWYQVNRVEFCEPYSSKLVGLLDQKWQVAVVALRRLRSLTSWYK